MGSSLEIKKIDADHYKIKGVIDEFSDLSEIFGSHSSGDIWIDLGDVTRINSSGIRIWMQSIFAFKGKIHLHNCSMVMVDQFVMIPSLVNADRLVESFYVHFVCDDCGIEARDLVKIGEDIDASNYEDFPQERACAKCGGTMMFDHSPELYFSFLNDLPKSS
jgi:hypothetical protein